MRGGRRKGSGRPTKAQKEQSNFIFATALSQIYKTDNDFDTKVEFVKELVRTQRGKMYVAEMLWGKPKDVVHKVETSSTFLTLTTEELKEIQDE